MHRKLDYASNYLKRVLGKKFDVTCGRGLSEASAGAARGGGGPGREGSKADRGRGRRGPGGGGGAGRRGTDAGRGRWRAAEVLGGPGEG